MTARLLYISVQSLDGYVEDAQGKFDWSRPDEEVHRFINELLRPIGTYLYGRRMYETMRGWESEYGTESDPAELRDFAQVWRLADKVVYSGTLKAISTPRTRLERSFDVEAVRASKVQARKDLTVGGSGLAAHALRAGLVDELHLFICPCIVGGGKPFVPADMKLNLALVDHRRFGESGVVYLRYVIRA
jgi:dihydrofolate reductase